MMQLLLNHKTITFLLFFSCCVFTGCQSSHKYDEKFNNAFEKILVNEGGYVNDPADDGGETKYGISKRSHAILDIKNLTIEQAMDVYYEKYWTPLCVDIIYDCEVATKFFDIAVNFGQSRAKEIMKRALRSVYKMPKLLNNEEDWGIVLFFINRVQNPQELLAALRSESAAVYRMIAAKNTTKEKFLNIWLNRAYK